jgi:hypothetical protein
VVEVNVPGGGGAVGTLQDVTDLGNSTTNDIAFTATAGILLDNGARLRKGTTNAGLGGNNGIAQRCSIDYELKWEAGRLYYMEQDGFTIRDVTHNFSVVPQVTDDSTKGFVVGSRWSLDDGTVYECSDATIGAAVWAVVVVGGVTSVTATAPLSSTGGTTPDISIQPASSVDDGYLTSADWNTFDGKFDVPTGTSADYLDGTGAPTAFPTIPSVTPSALTKSDDTNVTLTLGGSPTTSLLAATSLTLGWSGTLADSRIASAATWNAKQNAITTGTTLQYLRGDLSLATFPSIPAAQIQSDWNQASTSALDYIKNKPTIPAGGLPAGGTAGQILTKVDATDYNATWQENFADWTSVVKHTVKNNGLSGTITKGTAVYVTGSNGTNMLVGRASNASESTSSKTMGLMESDITTTGSTQTGFVITEGLIANLNTAGTTAGDPVWLGVNGALIYGLINKPYAPAHLVFIGIVTKVSAGNGEIFVKVQNGFELKEIHDVDLITTTPVNGDVLGFDGTLWVNKTVATWLGFTPVTNARTISTTAPLTGGGDLTANRTLAIAKATASVDGYLAATDFTIFAAKQAAITPAALTKVDDTNVTLTLGGTPTTALLQAASLTLGWSGTLADARITSAATWNAKQNAITLTTTGTSGAATLTGATLNIPQYSGGGGANYKSTTDSASFSNTTNTVVYTQLIAANTFAVGDIIRLSFRTRKTGVLGNQGLRIYVNSTPDLSGSPILVSVWITTTITNLLNQMLRHWVIKNATTNTESLSALNTSTVSDIASTTGMVANAIDWTANRYIVFALANTNAADVNFGSMFLIEKL